MAGRKQVFKVPIASKPGHTAIMKTVSQEIKHATLIADHMDGGLTDVDTDSKFESLKSTWIQKLKNDSNHHPWKALAQKILEECDSDYIFHSNLKLFHSCAKAVKAVLHGTYLSLGKAIRLQ